MVRRSGAGERRAGLGFVGGDEREQRQIGEQADAAGERRDDEADADQDRVDAEVAGEAAGDAGDLLVGGGAGEGAREEVEFMRAASRRRALAPLGMTPRRPSADPAPPRGLRSRRSRSRSSDEGRPRPLRTRPRRGSGWPRSTSATAGLLAGRCACADSRTRVLHGSSWPSWSASWSWTPMGTRFGTRFVRYPGSGRGDHRPASAGSRGEGRVVSARLERLDVRGVQRPLGSRPRPS